MVRRLSLIVLALGLAAAPRAAHAAATFAFGSNVNGKTGQNTATGNTSIPTGINESTLGGASVVNVAANGGASLLRTRDGRVFAFGSNADGQTGLNTTAGDTLLPTLIDTTNIGSRTIKQMDLAGHALLLANDGTVFSFGSNAGGRTGQGTDTGSTNIATAIDLSALGAQTVTKVAAGGAHSLLLTSAGTVYGFGKNDFAQIGTGATNAAPITAPTAVDLSNLNGKKVVDIAAGAAHSLILDEDGVVYSFGYNSNGRTGRNTTGTSNTLKPTAIVNTNFAGKKIVDITAGTYHSLIVAEDGTVYSFGWNGNARTGLGFAGLSDTGVATQIDGTNLAGVKIVQAEAGVLHSLLLDDQGRVYSFGNNNDGKTGRGLTGGNTTVATPVTTTNLTDVFITDIAVGNAHSLFTVPEPAALALLAIAFPLIARRV